MTMSINEVIEYSRYVAENIKKRRKADMLVQQREEYITSGMCVHDIDDVIAWMPIPEYRGDDND